MIRLTGLVKEYGDVVAVGGVDLEIRPGEVFGFLGPNGAGKTTTIRMITGLVRPTAGRVEICGHDMALAPRDAKRCIGYVADQPFVYEKLSAREFLRFVGGLFDLTEEESDRRSAPLLKTFALTADLDRLLEGYSHGMRQKVAMIAALLHDPQVLVVDEPMVGLDPRSILLVKDLFRGRAQAGATTFLSTHILDVAETVCTRIGIIHHGRLIAIGTMDELRGKAEDRASNLEEVFLRLTEEACEGTP